MRIRVANWRQFAGRWKKIWSGLAGNSSPDKPGSYYLGVDAQGHRRSAPARAADLRDSNGNFNIDYAQSLLEAIRDLSFVKIRESDSRFFLHDEMYDLLDRHVLRQSLEPERERVYDAVEYYKAKVKAARRTVYELGQPRRTNIPAGDETVPGLPKPIDDPKALEEAARQLYDVIAEEVHYRLRHHPLDGYHSYLVYAQRHPGITMRHRLRFFEARSWTS